MRQRLIPSAAFSVLVGLLAWPACAALESRVYQTVIGATVVERGDDVPNGSRVMPLSATLTFDLIAGQPSLTALITNAVLEGGDPFALTVRSSGAQLTDGTYWFNGDYLREICPSGSQYGFDWRFSTSTNGSVVWNGNIGWWGGHFWDVTISNVTLVAAAWLNISRVGSASAQITWATNFTDHVLEYATGLPAAGWSIVTNAATTVGDRHSVTVVMDASQQFYRLRKP